MKKWEYYYAFVDQSDDPVGEINKLGAEGWEVCAFEPENKLNHGVFYLKREVAPWSKGEPTLAELIRAVEESKRSLEHCDMLIRATNPRP